MRKLQVVGMAMVASLFSLGLYTPASHAQAAYPTRARNYKVRFVRAMDECTGPYVTVVNPGGVQGCLQANSNTDNSTTMQTANLNVISLRKGVSTRLTGTGFTPNTKVSLQLTLRTSNTLGTPPGSKTYEDVTVNCGDTNGGSCGSYYLVGSNGRVRGSMSLSDCLTANGLSTSLATGNVEILDAGLVNCDTGKVIAVPGVVH